MYSETYSEYRANCAKCGKEVLEVIEYMDSEQWDEESGVCPKCKILLCGKCVKWTSKAGLRCPYCFGELMDFDFVYDLIGIIEHNYQPFETKQKTTETPKETIAKLENLLEEIECDATTTEMINKQIRELKIQDMFLHGQKRIEVFCCTSPVIGIRVRYGVERSL
jgi:DNA-directed RNA polymerase subunit RPC12/RpoP